MRPLVDALRAVRVHSLHPHDLSQPQSSGAPPPLDDTGSNWCAVLRSLSPRARSALVDAMGIVLDDVVLFDHLAEAATRTQVVITTHSPDLLDLLSIEDVRVQRREGATSIGPVADRQASTVRDGLLAPGGLLRAGGLAVDGPVEDMLDGLGETGASQQDATR